MARRVHRGAVIGLAALICVGTLSACGANDAAEGGDEPTIALLLPEVKTTRYENFDRPLFEAKVKADCSECKVIYSNANSKEADQRQQIDSAITQGADVIVLDPVDGVAAAASVKDAQESDIPVIAYDRFIEGADIYMSFENETVGEMQAQALVDELGDKGNILMVNGSPDDANAGQFKAGAHNVIDASGLTVLNEYDTDWSPEDAEKFVTDQITAQGVDKIDGIYAANDGTAGGAWSALDRAGVKTADMPPITGQDSELEAIRRIVQGQQMMTIYKSIKVEAEKAAEVAIALAKGEDVEPDTEFQGVDAFIFDPVVVTKDKIADTVVADEFWSVEDICKGIADACAEVGLE